MAQPKKQGLPRHSRVVDGNVARSASYQQTGKRTVVDMLSNPSTDVAQKVNLRIPGKNQPTLIQSDKKKSIFIDVTKHICFKSSFETSNWV